MGDGVAEPSIMACHHGHLNGWIMSNGASLPDVAILSENRQRVRSRESITLVSSGQRFMQLRVQFLR
jgi:hypothetical protein